MKSINFTKLIIEAVVLLVCSLFVVMPLLELIFNYSGMNSGWLLPHSLLVTLAFYNAYKWNQTRS